MKRQFSNNVLFDSKGSYYLPAYLRLLLKQITDVSIQQTRASMNATLILSVYYKGLPQNLHNYLQRIEFMFGNQEKVVFIADGQNANVTKTLKKKDSIVTYFYRSKFPLKLSCKDIFFTPFDTIDLKLDCCIRSINCEQGVKIKFNLMDTQQFNVKFSELVQEQNGEFGIATKKLDVRFSNQRQIQYNRMPKQKKSQNLQLNQGIKQIQNQTDVKIMTEKNPEQEQLSKKNKNFQYATYTINLFRYPGTTILTIFIPIWLLAFINCAIFFSSTDLSGRLQNIAGLMIAYTAFFPTIRQRVPPSSKITFTDILIYSLIMTTMLCTVRSIIIAGTSGYTFIWYEDWIFLLCIIIGLLSVFLVVGLMLVYKLIWQPSYVANERVYENPSDFDSLKWKNSKCDQYFINKCKIAAEI